MRYYGILGPLELRDGSRLVSLAQGRQRQLLAVLLLHPNEVVSSDRLIDLLWGEAPPPSAAGSLHNLISGLRKGLGSDELLTHGHGYLLRVAAGELDAERFETLVEGGRTALASGDPETASALLREGLALWRGPALGDLDHGFALQDAVAMLEERRLAALEERIDADLALGRHAELTAELEGLVATHPLRERLRCQQMLALYRCGRQAEALRVYSDGRRELVAELGIEPGPALRRLERAVLDQDPALGASDPLPNPPLAAPTGSHPSLASGWARRHPGLAAGTGTLLLAVTIVAALMAGTGGKSTELAAGNSLAAIDPATNRVMAQVPVGGTPADVAVGSNAAWTINADEQTVSRIDFRTRAVRTFSTGAIPFDLATGGRALWILQGRRLSGKHPEADQNTTPTALVRIDPSSLTRRSTTALRLPHQYTFRVQPPNLAAVGGGAAWAIGRPGWVHRLDLRSERLLTLRSLDALDIASGDGQIWILDRRSRVVRLDPRNGRPLTHVPVPARWLDSIAVGTGAVWLTDSSAGTVWRVDTRSHEARTIDVGEGADGIAVGAGAVWVTNSVRGTLTRIDPVSNRLTARIAVGGAPRGVAVGGGRVWVSVAGTVDRTLPAAGGLRPSAKVKALPAPPCGRVLTARGADPDVLIASDLPLRAQLHTTLPMSEAVAFVLRQHGFRAGRFRIGYQSCDDASGQLGVFDTAKCRANATAYADNPAIVGVVGPLNSDCAQGMLPILGRARGGPLALVSPANSSPALVRSDPVGDGPPLRTLYPRGQRGYARVYPSDDYEAAAGALLARRLGHGAVFFLEDRDYSATLPWRAWFRRAANRIGLRIAGMASWRVRAKSYRRLAEQVRASGVRAVYLNTEVAANIRQLLHDLRAALGPRVAIIGNQGLLPISVLFKNAGPVARGVHITSEGLPLERLDAEGRRFVRDFGVTQPDGHVTSFDVDAAAATEVLLDAISRSDGSRASVTRMLATTRLVDGVLGPLALEPNGEPVANHIAIVRAQRGGGDTEDIEGLEGGVVEDVITPPSRLVGPG